MSGVATDPIFDVAYFGSRVQVISVWPNWVKTGTGGHAERVDDMVGQFSARLSQRDPVGNPHALRET